MRKKFLCMALAGAMVLSLAACGSKEENNEPSATPTVEAAPTEGEQQPTEAPTETPAAFEDFSVTEMLNGILERVEAPAMMEGSEYELTELYHIPAEKVEEFSVRVPMMNVTATELAAFKAASEDDVQTVVDGINQRVQELTTQWETYLPDQLELVQNHKLLVQGRYVFLIIGEEELSSYSENVFMRKFDPSIEEMVLVRKFNFLEAVITELTEDKLTVDYTEGDATYTFECTYGENFYAEGGLENFAVGDTISITFEEPIPEAESPMQGVVNYINKGSEE